MAKISISLDDELLAQVRQAAGDQRVSAWIAEAASARVRREALQAVASEIAEATGGPFTERELDEARCRLGWSSTAAA